MWRKSPASPRQASGTYGGVPVPKRDATLPGLAFADMSKDQQALTLKVMAELVAPYRKEDGDEVMEEDLGTQDLIDDGADAADMTPDDLQVAVDRTLHVDEPGEETIAQRIAQEEPDVQP